MTAPICYGVGYRWKKASFPTIQYVSEVEGRENSGTCSKEVSSGTVMVIIRISLTQIFLLFPHSLLLNTFPLYWDICLYIFQCDILLLIQWPALTMSCETQSMKVSALSCGKPTQQGDSCWTPLQMLLCGKKTIEIDITSKWRRYDGRL